MEAIHLAGPTGVTRRTLPPTDGKIGSPSLRLSRTPLLALVALSVLPPHPAPAQSLALAVPSVLLPAPPLPQAPAPALAPALAALPLRWLPPVRALAALPLRWLPPAP